MSIIIPIQVIRSKEMHFEKDNYSDWPDIHLKRCPMCEDADAAPIAMSTPATTSPTPRTATQTQLHVGIHVLQ